MLLKDKIAIVYGGGGAIGGAAARAFAREGAKVYLAGRTLSKLQQVADDIKAAGGEAAIGQVDALDAQSLQQHAAAVAKLAGHIDIVLNAIGIAHVQGLGFGNLTLDDYMHPVLAYTRSNFLTAQAVSPYMVKQRSGVMLTLSTPGARLAGQGFMGNGVSSAAVEAFSRLLAAELGPSGVRVVCLRPDAIPDAVVQSHTESVFNNVARQHGTTVAALLEGRAQTATLLKRLPTLAQVANTAAFLASDSAAAMTGAIVNLTCGSLVD